MPDGGNQCVDPFGGNLSGSARGRDPTAVQRFAGIDVSQSGNGPLVKQDGLYRRRTSREPLDQVLFVERVSQRFGAKSGKQTVVRKRFAWAQIHGSEAARVVECDAYAAFHGKRHMVMPAVCRGCVPMPSKAVSGNARTPRHSEMDEQRFPGIKVSQQVFRPPPQAKDAPVFQPFRHMLRKRPPQSVPPDFGANDQAAFHGWQQPPADRFDLRQFRHRVPLVTGRQLQRPLSTV